jgi:repressor LexA
VALLNGEEATLKRFFKEPNRVRLEPANSTMQPIYSAHVDILGVVSGVIRKY